MNENTILQVKGVKKAYPLPNGEKFYALSGIDASIPRGGLTILKGRSGSGKTTLMNIMSALDDATEGEVVFDGQVITGMAEKDRTLLRRRSIGFVFQSVALIPIMSAFENVDYALRLAGYKGDRAARAMEVLELVGLSKRATHMPSELSGGEQQRVAIARAIAPEPGIVFADEPTGELDTGTALKVVRIFKELNQRESMTVVMTTHDRGFMDIGDRVYELENGVIINER